MQARRRYSAAIAHHGDRGLGYCDGRDWFAGVSNRESNIPTLVDLHEWSELNTCTMSIASSHPWRDVVQDINTAIPCL